jgi:cytidine deaminase
MREAERARRQAYAPYSGFAVGAALLARSGIVFHGCNVENASYGLSICAERSALFHAVSAGQRHFVAIAVAGPPGRAAPPCGACRQVLSEFAPRLEVIFRGAGGRLLRRRLDALLPEAFALAGAVRRSARPRRTRRKARR